MREGDKLHQRKRKTIGSNALTNLRDKSWRGIKDCRKWQLSSCLDTTEPGYPLDVHWEQMLFPSLIKKKPSEYSLSNNKKRGVLVWSVLQKHLPPQGDYPSTREFTGEGLAEVDDKAPADAVDLYVYHPAAPGCPCEIKAEAQETWIKN